MLEEQRMKEMVGRVLHNIYEIICIYVRYKV